MSTISYPKLVTQLSSTYLGPNHLILLLMHENMSCQNRIKDSIIRQLVLLLS